MELNLQNGGKSIEPLLILGTSVRSAVQSAARAGLDCRALDKFSDLDLRRCCRTVLLTDDLCELTEAVRSAMPGAWMYTGAFENRPALVERLSQEHHLLGNSSEVLRQVRDPLAWSDALRAAGLRCPDTSLDSENTSRDGTFLRKPIRSCGGGHIAPWRGQSAQIDNAAGEHYFQRLITGEPHAAIFVADGQRASLLGATQQLIGQQWAGACGFQYCGSIGPTSFSPREKADLQQIGNVLAQRFQLLGLFGVDYIRHTGGDSNVEIWPVEINPRYCASIEVLERSLGFNAIALHVGACRNHRLPDFPIQNPTIVRHRSVGKVVLFAKNSVTIRSDFLEPIASEWQDRSRPTVADVPSVGTRIESGCPIITLLCEETHSASVLATLQARAAEMFFRLSE